MRVVALRVGCIGLIRIMVGSLESWMSVKLLAELLGISVNHATLKVGVKCFRVVTWFGVCSYRKLKVSPELRRRFCPICLHDLERLRYFGSKDWFSGEFEKKSKFEADYCEDGRPVWFVDTRSEGYCG